MATDWIIEAAKALSQKEFGPDAVTAERAKVDPALLDAIDIALARQVPSVNEDSNQKGTDQKLRHSRRLEKALTARGGYQRVSDWVITWEKLTLQLT